jgi:hypothetical protein
MTDRLDALREAALRLDQAHDAMFHSPSPEAKAELARPNGITPRRWMLFTRSTKRHNFLTFPPFLLG